MAFGREESNSLAQANSQWVGEGTREQKQHTNTVLLGYRDIWTVCFEKVCQLSHATVLIRHVPFGFRKASAAAHVWLRLPSCSRFDIKC